MTEVPREAIEAASRALRQLRAVQAGWAFGVPEGGRSEWLAYVATAAVEAAAPVLSTASLPKRQTED